MRLLMSDVCRSRMLQMLWTRALLDGKRMMRVLGQVSIQSTTPRPDFLHEIMLKE